MFIKRLLRLFSKKQPKQTPLLILKRDTADSNIKEYLSIEEAIADLGNDPNVSLEKIEKLRSSLKNLKNKSTIKIKNGDIIQF